MADNINLGSIKMPFNATTKSFAILAKRGAGKTYLGAVMAEEFAKASIPFVVFDPIDVWWGLRLAADGKGKGLPVVVFGIEHADIRIDRTMGREMAEAIIRHNISAVISTFGMSKADMRHLIVEFAETLLNINNTPRHVFIEEAHEFVPQRVQPGMGVVFSRVEALVTMGRNRGIGVTMLNQRAATINKDVLTQIDTLLALRSVGVQDRKALSEWVEHFGAYEEGDQEKKFNTFVNSLPSLPTGEGWLWSPEFLGVFEKFKIRKRETFHPDREKLGSDFVMPQLDQIDIQSFIEKFKSQVQAKEQPGKSTRNNRGQQHVAPASLLVAQVPPILAVDHREIQNIRNQYESQLIQKDGEIRRLSGIISQIGKIVGAGEVTISGSPIVVSRNSLDMWRSRLGNGAPTKILDFLSENAGQQFTRSQIGLATGLSMGASTIRNAISKLKRTGIVLEAGGKLTISPDL